MIAPTIRHRNAARGRDDRPPPRALDLRELRRGSLKRLWREGGALVAIVSVVALAALPAIVAVVRTIPLRVSLDANEGWNAYHAVDAFGGGLYPRQPPFFFNNYPPLSFYLVGAASRWIGDPIVAGRLVASLAFAMLVAIAYVASRQMQCARSEAAFGAALFLAATLSLSHYVGIDDPQFLSQAVAAAGLLFVIPAPRTMRRLCVAAMLMSTAVFIKHNTVALPIACVAWLWTHDRRAARRFAIAGISFAIVGFSLSVLLFGHGFLEGLSTPRAYSFDETVRAFGRWIVRVPVFLAALLVLLRRFPDDRDVAFCTWYAGVSSVIGLVFLGGDGVDWNVMFESNWAWCLTAAVALNRLTPQPSRARWMLAIAFALLPLVAALLAIRSASIDPSSSRASRLARAPAFEEDIAWVAARNGPALCEDLALCFWAGKPAAVDVVNLRQHIARGTRSIDDLVRLIDARFYAVIQIDARHSLLDPAARDALQRSYVRARDGASGLLFVPDLTYK